MHYALPQLTQMLNYAAKIYESAYLYLASKATFSSFPKILLKSRNLIEMSTSLLSATLIAAANCQQYGQYMQQRPNYLRQQPVNNYMQPEPIARKQYLQIPVTVESKLYQNEYRVKKIEQQPVKLAQYVPAPLPQRAPDPPTIATGPVTTIRLSPRVDRTVVSQFPVYTRHVVKKVTVPIPKFECGCNPCPCPQGYLQGSQGPYQGY